MISSLQRFVCCAAPRNLPADSVVADAAPVNARSYDYIGNQSSAADCKNEFRKPKDGEFNSRPLSQVAPLPPPQSPQSGQQSERALKDPLNHGNPDPRGQTRPDVLCSPATVSQCRELLQSESSNCDPLSTSEEQMRPSAPSCTSPDLETASPFISPVLPTVAPRSPAPGGEASPAQSGQRPQPQPPGPAAAAAADTVGGSAATFLSVAGSTVQALTRHLAAEEMPLSSSLSEPLLQSCSPGSCPHDPHNYSSSAGTAVTAASGGGGGVASAAAATAHSQPQAWMASATSTAAAGGDGCSRGGRVTTVGQRPPSVERPPLIASGARERKSVRAPAGVERSGGSRLGRPELAVVGATMTASSSSSLVVRSVVTAVGGPYDSAGTPAAAATVGAGAGGTAPVATGGSRGGGGGGGGALGMLGGMTRRLLAMVHDVSSAVTSQVAFVQGSQRADSTASTVAALPADAAAAAASTTESAKGNGGGGGTAAAHASVTERSTGGEPEEAAATAMAAAGRGGGGTDGGEALAAAAPAVPQQQQGAQQTQRRPAGKLEQWVQVDSGQPAATATVAAGGGAGGGGGGLYPPYVAARGSLRAGSDSGSAAPRRGCEDGNVAQLVVPYPPHPLDTGHGSTSRLPKHAGRDVSQVAMLQMMHFGSTSGRVPLQRLSTLNVASLSREIRALHWIGQGGGGAVFQGVWQGAAVAVKFMLAARPEHVDATALEGVVSLAVGHPNVVTTYSFDVSRLTEASLLPDAAVLSYRHSQQPVGGAVGGGGGGGVDDTSATALFNALMETDASLEPSATAGGGTHRHRHQHSATEQAGAPRPSGGAGGSRPAASYRVVDSLNTRVRRAQAAALMVSGSASVTPGSFEAPAAATPGPGHERGEQQYGTALALPPGQQLQNTPAAMVETLGIDSVFNSEEGFGDPDLTDNSRSWTVRHVLSYLKARPGMYMTHIIMEYCDRGSLMSAIKRGIFRMDGLPDDDVSSGAPYGWSSGGVTPTGPAAAAAAAGSLEPPRFTKRVVLRALLRTARDIAQGMCHLHANGIIHGDLKPANVLLRGCRIDRRGFTALVSDFGLSKVTRGDKPLELNHWSTVTVMAPEVILGRWLKASDVFSFGILLWQLVTGEMMPYGTCTVQQVLMGVAQGVLKPEWPSTAHPALVRLGRACLATSPEKRPSFEALVKILIKIEQHVRDELRVPRDTAAGDPSAAPRGGGGSSRHSRSSGSENVALRIDRLRSSAM